MESKKTQIQKKNTYTKPQEIRNSRIPLMAIRKVSRPASRKSSIGDFRRTDSCTSHGMTSRPVGLLIKPGYQSYSGRMKKASLDMRMKIIEGDLVKYGSQIDQTMKEKTNELKPKFSWRAFTVIASLLVSVLAFIFWMEVDISSYLSISGMLKGMAIQKKEKLPVIQLVFVKLRNLFQQIRK